MNKKEIKKIDERIETYQAKRFFILFVVFIIFGLLVALVISNMASANAGLIGAVMFAPLALLLFLLSLSWAGKYKRMIRSLEESKVVDSLSKAQRSKLNELDAKIANREAIKYWTRRLLFAVVAISMVAYLVAPLFPSELEDSIQRIVINFFWIHGTNWGIVIYILVTLFASVSIWKLEDKKDEILKK